MARKIQPWEAAARRSILGERCEFDDFDGFEGLWFRPRKYSVPGEEEINSVGIQLSTDLPKPIFKKLVPLYEGKDATKITPADFMKVLDEDEMAEVMQLFIKQQNANSEAVRLVLYHGIGEHNFTEDQTASSEVSSDLVEALLEYQGVTARMVRVIRTHNRPLAEPTPETSPTSPSGSTEKQTSASIAKTTPTEETQGS